MINVWRWQMTILGTSSTSYRRGPVCQIACKVHLMLAHWQVSSKSTCSSTQWLGCNLLRGKLTCFTWHALVVTVVTRQHNTMVTMVTMVTMIELAPRHPTPRGTTFRGRPARKLNPLTLWQIRIRSQNKEQNGFSQTKWLTKGFMF